MEKIFIHGFSGSGMISKVKSIRECSITHEVDNHTKESLEELLTKKEINQTKITKSLDFKYPDTDWSCLHRNNRIDSGKEFHKLLIKNKIKKIENLEVHSYGFEVFVSFLKENKTLEEKIKIDNVYIHGSPITHWGVKEIKENSLFEQIEQNIIMFYSDEDMTQVVDVTQSMINLFSWSPWKFRIFYAIRHNLPPSLSSKIKNIKCDKIYKYKDIQIIFHILPELFIQKTNFIKKIKEKLDKEQNIQNFILNKYKPDDENNTFELIKDTKKKEYFRWHHFGKIEKLILIFLIMINLQKKYKILTKIFSNLKKYK